MKRTSLFAALAMSLVTVAHAAPVQVYILAGQSNMEGQGFIAADAKRNGGKGSLEYLTKDAATAPRFAHLLDKDGKWKVRDDVWISYLDRKGALTVGFGATPDKIGPELGFGTVVGEASDAPILLIKCAWGGKSLAVDFRPPGAGKPPYSLGEKTDAEVAKDPEIVGKYYRETLALTKKALANIKELVPGSDGTYQLAGFGWHQGWNDRVTQSFNDEYEANMAQFIRDIRKDLNAPQLPFVIAETGMNGPTETHPRALSLMKAQAAVAEFPEFKGNVAFVGTRDFWRPVEQSPSGQGYHWNTNAETYYLIGEAMGHAMQQLRGGIRRQTRAIAGWTVQIDLRLLEKDRDGTEKALALLQKQLDAIVASVPAPAVAELRKVPLFLSPEYDKTPPRAEYHPGAAWLRENGRDPIMARGVEFTNVRIFEAEVRRMPVFVLHELSHAYHDRVLGNDYAGIKACYAAAKASGKYDKVERWHGDGRPNTFEKAYAMANPQEYFAETTEAYFGRNDYFPFTRDELKQTDPEMCALLEKVWGGLRAGD